MDGEDFEPKWPRRPDKSGEEKSAAGGTGRPASPPASPPAPGPQAPSTSSPSSWTSTPTQHDLSAGAPGHDESKETRALPLVEKGSRFDLGQRPPAAARPTPTTEPPATDPRSARVAGRSVQPGSGGAENDPPRRQPQPQPQSRPTPAHHARPDYSAYDDPTLAYRPGGQGHKAGNERERAGGSAHADSHSPGPQASAPRTRVDPSKSFLMVEVEGAKRSRFGAWLLTIVGVLIALVLIGGISFALAWQGQYSGKVYAGVSALGIDLGGKTPDEARQLLNARIEDFANEPVVLTWSGKEWKPSLEDLGVSINVDDTVDEAFRVGRDADFFGSIADQWNASQSGWQVPLTVQISEPVMQSYLDNIAESEIDQELFEGDVRLNGIEIDARPGLEGRTLDTYRTLGMIREVVERLEPNVQIDLPVRVVQPSVSAKEVEEVRDLLAIRISGPITATTLDKALSLDREALVRFTTIERNPDRSAPRHLNLGWRDNELDILAEKWVGEANRPQRSARFGWQNGQVVVLTESIDGFETDKATVMKAIKEHADKAEARQFDLPGKVVTATVSSKDLPALGITQLMGTGTSTFKGSSQERATNIRVAAELLNGAVVPPGGTFSFLQTMGGIDEAHGFVEGYVIAAERTQRGVGGGVCQVSTTMFRAAFWSGLEITERNEHSYRVGWYEANGEPVGFDAAVFDPGVDLTFVNNTPHYILVEAAAGADALTVNVYGTKQGTEVKLEGPVITDRVPPPPDVYEVDPRLAPGTKKQVETARSGLTTTVTRRILTPGQPDKVDQFKSTYKAWPNWFIVASASQIPGGAQAAPQPTPNP